ncbi:hypothetical protein Tco_0030819 [Tanacetum coccineum]
MLLRTTILGQMLEIRELHAADRRRQAVTSEMLKACSSDVVALAPTPRNVYRPPEADRCANNSIVYEHVARRYSCGKWKLLFREREGKLYVDNQNPSSLTCNTTVLGNLSSNDSDVETLVRKSAALEVRLSTVVNSVCSCCVRLSRISCMAHILLIKIE